jgi:hypothetical protein
MKRLSTIIAFMACLAQAVASPATDDSLEEAFATPPETAGSWVFWWWLNGDATKEGIVRDLDEMKAKGISGAAVYQGGIAETPRKTEFMSPEWRNLFGFAVAEAAKRDITISLNLCAGWNAGGPWVTEDDAARTLVSSRRNVRGPGVRTIRFPDPDDQTYRDLVVLAWKSAEHDHDSGGQVCLSGSMIDCTKNLGPDGSLSWDVPEGDWEVVRFGMKIAPLSWTKNNAGGPRYFEADPLNKNAMDRHFGATAGVLLDELREHAGKTFKYVFLDSSEFGNPNWTADFPVQFKRLRGYDPAPYLAALAGLTVDSPEISKRFLEDYDRTIGDLMIECYYGRLGELAREHGMGAHSEAGGYQKPMVDALRSMGCNDIAMSEFWARRSDAFPYIHQLAEAQLHYHDGIKNAASAAHIYGRKIVQAEAFTVVKRPNFDRDLFELKDLGDRAFCQGLNRMVFHHFVHQPEPDDQAPGYVWPNVGFEVNRKVTWWPLSHAWLDYLKRCHYLLQEGRFAADVCYFQGEWTPAYVPAKWAMDPPLPRGFDCDTINADALLTRASAGSDGRLLLPGGLSYRCLALWQGGRWQAPPEHIFAEAGTEEDLREPPDAGSGKPLAMSPPVLRKIKQLVEEGVMLVGPRPDRAMGLKDHPSSDAEIRRLADELWGREPAAVGERQVGKGRVIWGRSLAEVFRADEVPADLEIREDAATAALPLETLSGIPNPGSFDWIHRSIGDIEIYFIANLRNTMAAGEFTFRVSGRQPELWDPVTGRARELPEFASRDGRIAVPLRFEPRQSFFVVFRNPSGHRNTGRNFPVLETKAELSGPWELAFDPRWGGPESVVFEDLLDWTKHHEDGIRHYSGTAVYRKTFDLPDSVDPSRDRVFLDLGAVRNLARVRVNGKEAGILWTAPWRVEITGSAKPLANRLEIEVVNLWQNRIVADLDLPEDRRFTSTNATVSMKRFRDQIKPLSSGLLGPVSVLVERAEP